MLISAKRKHDQDYTNSLEDQVELLREEVSRLRAVNPNYNATEYDSKHFDRRE
jgi:hypothetical protein